MRKKSLAAILAVLILVLSFSSCSVNKKGSEFEDVETGVKLHRYTGSSTETEYIVPEEQGGKPVVEIGDFGLANAEYLKTVTIGKNVKTISPWALTNCSKLEAILVDEENEYFTSIDGVLYNKDVTEVVAYPNGKTPLVKDNEGKVIGGGEYVAPATVKHIRANAFYLCWNLYSVTLNEGLETVGDKAFLKCDNVRSINIPNTVTEIGVDAFSYMNTLTSLEIPSSVKKIGNYAFFATESNIDKIVVHNNRENIEIGDKNDPEYKDWLPNQKGTFGTKVPVEFVGP